MPNVKPQLSVPRTWTRSEAVASIDPSELAQAACAAFDAYYPPKPIDLNGADVPKPPENAKWRQNNNTCYTGSCFVTILDRTFLSTVFTQDGGILEVQLVSDAPASAGIHAVLYVERTDAGAEFLRYTTHVALPFVGFTQFLIRNKAKARLRVQMYNELPRLASKAELGSDDSGTQPEPAGPTFDLGEVGMDWPAEPYKMTVGYKDEHKRDQTATVAVSWRLVPFADCKPEYGNNLDTVTEGPFKGRLSPFDIRKENDKIMHDGMVSLEEKALARLVDPILPYVAQQLKKLAGSDDGSNGVDGMAEVRAKQGEALTQLAFVEAPDSQTEVWLHHDGRSKVVVAFRGTDMANLLEWLLDLCAHMKVPTDILATNASSISEQVQVAVHTGFADAYADVRGVVNALVRACLEELRAKAAREQPGQAPPELSVVVTGHSLGGALATLAAYDMARQQQIMHSDKVYDHMRVYTLGSPRVGNVAFMDEYNTLVPDTWRITTPHDIVPNVPDGWSVPITWWHTSWQSYCHVGAHIPIGPGATDPSDAHIVVGREEEAHSRNRAALPFLLADIAREAALRAVAKQDVAAGIMALPGVHDHLNYTPGVLGLMAEAAGESAAPAQAGVVGSADGQPGDTGGPVAPVLANGSSGNGVSTAGWAVSAVAAADQAPLLTAQEAEGPKAE